MKTQVKTLEALIEILKQHPRAYGHVHTYGCDVDTVIRTTTCADAFDSLGDNERIYVIETTDDILWQHYNHIMAAVRDYSGADRVMFVRCLPEYVTNKNGDVTLKTRLYFGDEGKVIYPDKSQPQQKIRGIVPFRERKEKGVVG